MTRARLQSGLCVTRRVCRVTLRVAALVVLSCGVTFAQTGPTAVEYYHLDAVGSVRAVTDQSGNVVRRHDYFPFGEEYAATPGTDSLRFSGKERDAETGFDYFSARHYASRSGRFTTVDPIGVTEAALIDPQRWNRYAYSKSNPLTYGDPDGRQTGLLVKPPRVNFERNAIRRGK